MRSSLRFWLALSLLLGAGAIFIWVKERPEKSAAPVAWSHQQPAPQSVAPAMPALLTTPAVLAATGQTPAKPQSAKSLT